MNKHKAIQILDNDMSELKTKKLFDGTVIPSTINTDERIFQIETWDNETVLCNLQTAQMLINTDNCKRLKHYWDYRFVTIGKREVKEMPLPYQNKIQ